MCSTRVVYCSVASSMNGTSASIHRPWGTDSHSHLCHLRRHVCVLPSPAPPRRYFEPSTSVEVEQPPPHPHPRSESADPPSHVHVSRLAPIPTRCLFARRHLHHSPTPADQVNCHSSSRRIVVTRNRRHFPFAALQTAVVSRHISFDPKRTAFWPRLRVETGTSTVRLRMQASPPTA